MALTIMGNTWLSKQERYFSSRIDAYREMYGKDTPFHRATTERFLKLADCRAGMRVIEFGCGVGRVTLPLLRLGCRVTAIDISAPALRCLEEAASQAGVGGGLVTLCARAEQIEPSTPVDRVIARGLLHHLEDIEPFFERALGALAPGGRAAFMDPNPLQPAWLPFVVLHPALSLLSERRLWRGAPWLMREMMQRAGFRGVASHFIGLVPPPLWSLGEIAGRLEKRLGASALRLLSLYHVVTGTR